MKTFQYTGNELDIFELAIHWKQYWISLISSYIQGRVLEVGAGTGNNTILLLSLCRYQEWTCLEPDIVLLNKLRERIGLESSNGMVREIPGTIQSLPVSSLYDTILYIDVLEHIQDDASEVQYASKILTQKGHIIVLAPAHPIFFTEFDKQIGHYRRYTIVSLKKLTPPNCMPVSMRYLDSMGMLLSLANRFFLRQQLPTSLQIRIWDRIFIRISRILDVVTLGKLGKSVLFIWKKL